MNDKTNGLPDVKRTPPHPFLLPHPMPVFIAVLVKISDFPKILHFALYFS